MILSFTPRLSIIPAYVETNQCTCRNVISRALRHAPAATQKGVADLCLCTYKCMCILVLKIFLLRSYKYVYITKRSACATLMHVQMHVHTGIKDFLAT